MSCPPEGREATVTHCPRKGRAGDEEVPRPLEKDTLPAPSAPSPTPHPPQRDVALQNSPPFTASGTRTARPPEPGRARQKRGRWPWDGHGGLPVTAAPKAPVSTTRSLARPSTPREHVRPESRHEPNWPGLCKVPEAKQCGRRGHIPSPSDISLQHPVMSQQALLPPQKLQGERNARHWEIKEIILSRFRLLHFRVALAWSSATRDRDGVLSPLLTPCNEERLRQLGLFILLVWMNT